jgi:hypothetical protein
MRKTVVIDGEYKSVPAEAPLAEILPPQVESVLTSEGHIIPRSEFSRWPIPDGFETNLTRQVKG